MAEHKLVIALNKKHSNRKGLSSFRTDLTPFLFDVLIMYRKIVSLSDVEIARALFIKGKLWISSAAYPYFKQAYMLGHKTPGFLTSEFLDEFEQSIVARIKERTGSRQVSIDYVLGLSRENDYGKIKLSH